MKGFGQAVTFFYTWAVTCVNLLSLSKSQRMLVLAMVGHTVNERYVTQGLRQVEGVIFGREENSRCLTQRLFQLDFVFPGFQSFDFLFFVQRPSVQQRHWVQRASAGERQREFAVTKSEKRNDSASLVPFLDVNVSF